MNVCSMQLKMNNTVIDWNNYMREVYVNTLLCRPEVKIVEIT